MIADRMECSWSSGSTSPPISAMSRHPGRVGRRTPRFATTQQFPRRCCTHEKKRPHQQRSPPAGAAHAHHPLFETVCRLWALRWGCRVGLIVRERDTTQTGADSAACCFPRRGGLTNQELRPLLPLRQDRNKGVPLSDTSATSSAQRRQASPKKASQVRTAWSLEEEDSGSRPRGALRWRSGSSSAAVGWPTLT